MILQNPVSILGFVNVMENKVMQSTLFFISVMVWQIIGIIYSIEQC